MNNKWVCNSPPKAFGHRLFKIQQAEDEVDKSRFITVAYYNENEKVLKK